MLILLVRVSLLPQQEPRFQIIIVNRLSRNNFFHAITPTFHSEVVEPYLIFKSVSDDGTPLIHGIWFPADQERERISDVLTKCIRTQAAGGGDVSVLQDPQQRQAQAAKEAAAAQRAAEQREVQERQQALVLKQQAAAAKQLERERAAARQKDATPPPPPPRQEAAAQKLQQAKPPRALAATPAGAAAPGVPLLTPGMILGEDKVPKLSINGGSAALDRAGLKEALLALLDDDTFLDAIHSKYAQVTVKA